MDSMQHGMFPQELIKRLSGMEYQRILRFAVLKCETDELSKEDLFSRKNTLSCCIDAALSVVNWEVAGLAACFYDPLEFRDHDFETLTSGLVDAYEVFARRNREPFDRDALVLALNILARLEDKRPFAAVLNLLLVENNQLISEQKITCALEAIRQEVKRLNGFLGPPVLEDTRNKSRRKGKSKSKPRSTLRGPKTETMDEQLKEFRLFVASKKQSSYNASGKMTSIRKLAHMFWFDNKKKFDKCAVASGEKKGYGSFQSLLNAYNNTSA